MIDIGTLSSEVVGNRIKAAREDRDITQKLLAELIFVSPSTMNRIEKGEKDVSIEQLGLIANILDVKIEYLLGIDKDTSFIDDFIALFDRLTTSKNFLVEDSGVYSAENLMYSMDKEYIVLTGKRALFELIKEIAKIKGQKEILLSDEYESRLNAARNTYKETRAALHLSLEEVQEKSETYFLITGKQISEIVDVLVKSEKALAEIEIRHTKTTDRGKRPPLRLRMNKK